MTLLDDRPATGLTTDSRGYGAFAWPTATGTTTPTQSARALPRRSVRFAVNGPDGPAPLPPYIRDLGRKLNELLALPDGWNHRGARQTTVEAVEATARILLEVMTGQSLFVQLFPLPDGGIQAEWHVGDSSVEIEVDGNGSALIVVEENEATLIEEELDETSTSLVLAQTRQHLAKISRGKLRS